MSGESPEKPQQSLEQILTGTLAQPSPEPTHEWPSERAERLGPSFEVIGTFSTPDQVEELDFKKFLEQPLFNRSFYRTNMSDVDGLDRWSRFEKLVLEPSVPFSGVKGGGYEEALILKQEKDDAIMAGLDIEPISLDEWRYLFSQLTEKQITPTGDQGRWGGVELSRDTEFFVRFDDGIVRIIEASFNRDGGPYGYSLSVRDLAAESNWSIKHSHVIAPKK